MSWVKKIYPFNAEQTVNIASEFGPLVALFVVNAITGNVEDGTWALIIATFVAIIAMQVVLKRLPIFPLIASGVTVLFGILTLVTHNPMWVQIKVTIFNAMFAGFLLGGLWATSKILARKAFWSQMITLALGLTVVVVNVYNEGPDVLTDMMHPAATVLLCGGAMLLSFLLGGLVFKKNFFAYAFERTFHYTEQGWDHFTYSFALFFMATALANEVVRQFFAPGQIYNLFGMQMDGVSVWILFKVALIMPASGIYAWLLTRIMQKHRIPDTEVERKGVVATAATAVPVSHKKAAPDATPAS